jgi:hypothetical protein
MATIDTLGVSRQNGSMKTKKSPLTFDEDADAQAVIEHAMTGKPLDPEIAHRVRERSEHATKTLRLKSGTVNITVDLIREVRDQQ